jgi:DNA-binding response OmpR family regulator
MMRIALLEDEPPQMQLLVATLETLTVAGYENTTCEQFTDGELLRSALRTDSFDLLILDWNVPGLDGLQLLRWLREYRRSTVPVILLSARGAERDVAEALSAGANDYVIKPFRPIELMARVKRFFTPQETARGWVETIGEWKFFHESATVIHAGLPQQLFTLSEREFSLAIALFRNLGRVVSRFYLLEATNQDVRSSSTRVLDNQIFKVRRKLSLESNGLQLQTIYGQGYRLSPNHAATMDGGSGAP